MSSDLQWPADTGDTGNVLSGTPLGGLAAAGFSINYEALPQAITDLRHAADFFESRMKVAEQLARISPPGIDKVSINAVAQIGKWASNSGQNNMAATLKAGASQLRDLADKLEKDLKTYLNVEELNLPKEPTGGLRL